MNAIYVISSGESGEYGFAIKSTWLSKDDALTHCKKLIREEIAKATERVFYSEDYNVERWTVGEENSYRKLTFWEVEYDLGKAGRQLDEKLASFRAESLYVSSEDEIRVRFSVARGATKIKVQGHDKSECLRILTAFLN